MQKQWMDWTNRLGVFLHIAPMHKLHACVTQDNMYWGEDPCPKKLKITSNLVNIHDI